MMSHEDWLKSYKNCPAKVYAHGVTISQYYRELTPHGHLMCGELFPIGVRCMYKKCPKIKGQK